MSQVRAGEPGWYAASTIIHPHIQAPPAPDLRDIAFRQRSQWNGNLRRSTPSRRPGGILCCAALASLTSRAPTDCLLVSHSRHMLAARVWVDTVDMLLAVICRQNQGLYINEIRQMRWAIKRLILPCYHSHGLSLQTTSSSTTMQILEVVRHAQCRPRYKDLWSASFSSLSFTSPVFTISHSFLSSFNSLFQDVRIHSLCGGFGRRLIRFCKTHCSSRRHQDIHN